jgi:hypothetical protein
MVSALNNVLQGALDSALDGVLNSARSSRNLKK